MAGIRVLFAQGGLHHPFAACAAIAKSVLQECGFAHCDIVERDVLFEQDWKHYDVIALYTQGGTLTAAQEKRLTAFVRDGKGLVGIHSAAASYRDSKAFQLVLGARFGGHAPGTPRVTVEVTQPDHVLATGLLAFQVSDEIYQLELVDNQCDVFQQVFWRGERIPMAYTREVGRGRVFYTANGHDERVFRHAEFQRLLLRGVAYAAGRWQARRRPLGVGVLGYGGAFNMGKHHIDNAVASGGFSPVAVCDLDPARRAQAEQDVPGIKTYPSLKAMLKDDRVEMVINITPHNAHHPTVVEALKAGRHVVVEKPFCITQKQADDMISTARKHKVMLAVYQSRRWDHHFLTARKLVQSGCIGEVFETHLDFGGYGHPGTWWRSDKKISGGLMYDWGAHAIDWMLHIIPHRVVGVSGYYQFKRKWHMCSNEDHGRALIRFENGAVANFSNSQLNASGGVGWLILGVEGAIKFPTVFDQEATVVTFPDGVAVTTKVPCEPSDWAAFYRNVCDHVHHEMPLICRGETSARVIGIIETAEQSARQGRELPFKDVYYGK